MLDAAIARIRSAPPQTYLNGAIVSVGLAADLVALGTLVGAIRTPVTGSNFYVNSREFLAWVLVAIVYSVGFLNAVVRRRWRRLYGTSQADHSVMNAFSLPESSGREALKARTFKRDFSVLYVVLFPVTFLYSRAITATEVTTGVTGSPWGDVALAAVNTTWVTICMMVVTSMFDFAMSIFVGDQVPATPDHPT